LYLKALWGLIECFRGSIICFKPSFDLCLSLQLHPITIIDALFSLYITALSSDAASFYNFSCCHRFVELINVRVVEVSVTKRLQKFWREGIGKFEVVSGARWIVWACLWDDVFRVLEKVLHVVLRSTHADCGVSVMLLTCCILIETDHTRDTNLT